VVIYEKKSRGGGVFITHQGVARSSRAVNASFRAPRLGRCSIVMEEGKSSAPHTSERAYLEHLTV
jgi:hypothetical protein